MDIPYLPRIAPEGWTGNAVVYSHLQGDLIYLPNDASLSITLRASKYQVFTVIPIKDIPSGAGFAPIGLIKMFNSGGVVKDLKYDLEKPGTVVIMKLRGSGAFGAYSSVSPKRITVDGKDTEFNYEEASGFVTFGLYLWEVNIEI